MQDQEIRCVGVDRNTPCPYNATFIHSVKDQEFYARQGFEAPKRCRDCREAKKAMKDSHGGQNERHGGSSERRDHGYRDHRRSRFTPDREIYGMEGEE